MLQKSFVNFLQEGNVSIAQKEVTLAEGKHRLPLKKQCWPTNRLNTKYLQYWHPNTQPLTVLICWRITGWEYTHIYIHTHRAVLWAVQLVRSHRAPRPATNGIEPPPRNAIANGPRGAPLHTSHRAPRQPGTALHTHTHTSTFEVDKN